MDDLISRQAVLDKAYELDLCDTGNYIILKVVDVDEVEKLPTAEPEIIRCRDCKYGVQDDEGRWYCYDLGGQMGDDDGSGFCSDAERREDDIQP